MLSRIYGLRLPSHLDSHGHEDVLPCPASHLADDAPRHVAAAAPLDLRGRRHPLQVHQPRTPVHAVPQQPPDVTDDRQMPRLEPAALGQAAAQEATDDALDGDDVLDKGYRGTTELSLDTNRGAYKNMSGLCFICHASYVYKECGVHGLRVGAAGSVCHGRRPGCVTRLDSAPHAP